MTSDSPRVPEAAQPEGLVGAPDKERPDAREGARQGWVVEWREAPPFKGRDYDFHTSKRSAMNSMTGEELTFKGESLVLYRAELLPVRTKTKQDGEVAT